MKTKYVPLLSAFILMLGIFLGKNFSHNSVTTSSPTKLHSFNYLVNEIQSNYVDSLDWNKLEEALIERTLAELDPHSYYIPPVEITGVNESLNGHFGGIGVSYRIINDTITILSTLDEGPARLAGLQLGDQVIGAGGNTISKTFTNDSLLANLKGRVGEATSVTYKRKKLIKTVDISRAEIPIESINSFFELNSGHYYIRLNRFSHRSFKEFLDSLNSIENDFQNLSIDLRDNGGGSLQNAVDIARLFLSKGDLITYTEGENQARVEYKAEFDGPFKHLNLDIWVNENSASASEILAGSLQYHEKARVIGRNTFGKGLVQQQFDLPNTGGFRLVVAKYYTPAGICIQRPYKDVAESEYYNEIDDSISYGIKPNVEIPIDTVSNYTEINKIYTLGFLNKILSYTIQDQEVLKKYLPKDLLDKRETFFKQLVNEAKLSAWEKDYVSRLIAAEIGDLIYGNNTASEMRMMNDRYLEFIKNNDSKH